MKLSIEKFKDYVDDEFSLDQLEALADIVQDRLVTIKTAIDKANYKPIKGFHNPQYEQVIYESLRDWFKKEKWVRITTSGNIAGPCGTSKNKKNPDRCLPRAKAQSLTKAQRAATARKKKKAGAKGKTVVKNTKKATVRKENLNKVSGGIPYRIEGNKAIISMPLPDDAKERIIKRAKEHGYNAKPNMGGGVTIFKEIANLQVENVNNYVNKIFGTVEKAGQKLLDTVSRETKQTIYALKEIAEMVIKREKPSPAESKKIVEQLKDFGFLGALVLKDKFLIFAILYYIIDKSNIADELLKLNETSDPQDGKAAPYGSGFKPTKMTRKQIEELVWEVVTEKDDRCTRIAKRKYDTWPSAYASGAVVRCRRGEIWKGQK
tara:strand:+ start:4067 stop:5197 length:1131 start_codon:yes stop_codon:yes gene_type:complete